VQTSRASISFLSVRLPCNALTSTRSALALARGFNVKDYIASSTELGAGCCRVGRSSSVAAVYNRLVSSYYSKLVH
jgi:hypothetical protein